ncbi:hypothetical protein [Methylobacterium sp. PvR107]|uniref:hypothetical protein n=1 Tax=Methylobacterium sp. PvR107 TaxID=2806597 RepID=UPI001AE720EA|nr:hypothetical protein [Methylobacterium sp. PvR107]MBP1181633.1 hypothetical protein [Methylobacterium sp. PvR107]
MASRVERIGRLLSVFVALVLIATSVMPLVAEARGVDPSAHAHAFYGIDHDDHDDGHGTDGTGAADLAHHAHSHAQTLATAQPSVPTMSVRGTDVRFRAVNHLARRTGEGRAPFEPPRG